MKKFLSFTLSSFLALSLFGCGLETPQHDASNAVHQSAAPAPTAEDLELVRTVLTNAKARKEAILSSPTEIVESDEYIPGETYTGTAYYVSNSGSDKNNGKSPETAFATLKPFKWGIAKPGDAIFFERGSLWRCMMVPNNLRNTEQITYSAYGQGEKPKLYYSPENGTGEEKWDLAYEDESGKKIWKFYKEMSEVSAIILNEETIVKRDIAYWDGQDYYTAQPQHVLWAVTNTPYAVETELGNMECFPEIYYPAQDDTGRIFVTKYSEDGPILAMGDFYFRCDEGNPGALFQEIEFISPYYFNDGMSHFTVMDNLNIQYSTFAVTSGRTADYTAENCVVQNCEIAWMGGGLFHYGGVSHVDEDYLASDLINQNGGCLSLNGSGCIARKNYIHHGYQDGITFETFRGDPSLKNVTISSNLVESCVQPMLLCNWDQQVDPDHIFSNCVIEDNIAMYQGSNSWYANTNEIQYEGVIKLQGGPCGHDGTLYIRNNTFAFAEGNIVVLDVHTSEYSTVFSGNTYIAAPGAKLLQVGNLEIDSTSVNPSSLSTLLGDETCTVVRATP